MTKTFKLTSDNDLYVDNTGNLVVLSGLAAVLAACETAAKAQKGEMIRAVNRGVPNFQLIWNGNPNLVQFESAVRSTLKSVSGVVQITDFNVSILQGDVVYYATIETEFGTGVISSVGA